jgi:tetratricopeptide (TPR) repeat protein
MRAAFRISLLALVLGVGSTAHAQEAASEPTPAQVRVAAEAFDRGREAYKAGDYIEAAEQFEKADSNAPSSAALELAIRARDKAGELDRAATLLALALKRHPDDENLLKISADVLKRAGQTLFELTANCDVACELTVGGKLLHGAPDTQRVIYVAPGALTVRAGWSDNRSDSKQVQAEAGGKGEVTFVAPATAAAKTMAEEASEPIAAAPPTTTADEGVDKKSSGWSPTVFYVGAGLTAVVGGITVWSGIDTVNNPGADRVKTGCGTQGEACALYQEGLSKQRRTNVLIGVTAGVGVGTLLVGLLATDWSSGNKPSDDKAAARLRPHVAVAPWASLDGGGLQAVGRF